MTCNRPVFFWYGIFLDVHVLQMCDAQEKLYQGYSKMASKLEMIQLD